MPGTMAGTRDTAEDKEEEENSLPPWLALSWYYMFNSVFLIRCLFVFFMRALITSKLFYFVLRVQHN